MTIARRLRMAMAGGGEGAFIGGVHRMAAQMDSRIDLVAGVFSTNSESSKAFGRTLGLPEHRVYGTYEEMIRAELELDASERADFVSIVTPNHEHFPMASRALESGLHVLCDKPLCLDLTEARRLQEIVNQSGLLFGLTHNYVGYPMVKEARARILAGELGALRKVVVEYPQGWLATPLEKTGHKQASWRADPKRSGAGGCLADIGTHAANLAEYVTGLRIVSLAAELTRFVPGRVLDDDAAMLLRFSDDVRGALWASQVAVGEDNGLNIRIYGERGSLAWRQEEPNTLVLSELGGSQRWVRAGANLDHLAESAQNACRLPAGHPEGFLEGFANIYKNYAASLSAIIAGTSPSPIDLDFPGIEEGVRGMAFIQAAVESSAAGSRWTDIARG